MTHLGADAAAPLSADEQARLGEHEAACIMPAPTDAGVPKAKLHGRVADRQFAYKDADGKILGYICRWDAHNGAGKEIRPLTFWRNGTGKGSWQFKTWPDQRPLFGLDQLAAQPDAIVLLTEGEKAAEAVEHGPLADAFKWAKHRVIGMTWPGGVKAIDHADFSPLVGRDVIVLPDHDVPGEAAADALVDVLAKVGVTRLRRWHPPEQANVKWDIADEVPDGITPEVMVKTMLEASDIGLRIVKTLAEFLADFHPPDYLIDGLLQKHFCYSLTGATGAGKTAIALLVSALVASHTPGRKLGSHEVEHGRVVYIAAENPTDIKMRLIGMAAKLKLDIDPRDFLAVEQIEALEKDMPRIEREIAELRRRRPRHRRHRPELVPGRQRKRQPADARPRQAPAQALRPAGTAVRCCTVPPDQVRQRSRKPAAARRWQLHRRGRWQISPPGYTTATCATCTGPANSAAPTSTRSPSASPPSPPPTLTDSKGRLLPTVMAELVTEAEAAATEEAAVDQEDKMLIAMHRRPDGSLIQWATDCRWFVAGDPTKPNKALAHRVANRLKRDKLVAGEERRNLALTKTGKAAAKKALAQQASKAEKQVPARGAAGAETRAGAECWMLPDLLQPSRSFRRPLYRRIGIRDLHDRLLIPETTQKPQQMAATN